MTRNISLITVIGAALVLAAPAFGRTDLSPVPQWQQALEARSEGLNQKYGLDDSAYTKALNIRSEALNQKHGLGAYPFSSVAVEQAKKNPLSIGGRDTVTSVSPLDRREQVFGRQASSALDAREEAFAAKRDAQLATAAGPDAFERALVTRASERTPVVVDDRFRIDPTTNPVSPVTVSSGRDIEWPQLGIGLGIGVLLALGVMLAMRYTRIRPLAH